MSDPFTDRLREAGVVLDQIQVEELRGAVERLNSARLSLDDTLARIRFAFLLPERINDRDRILATVNRDQDVVSPHGADQMLAVLCACALIDSFARKEPSRSAAVVRRMTIAALASRSLSFARHEPAHPDLLTWGEYWLGIEGRRMRETRRSDPPRLGASGLPDDATGEQKGADALERLQKYAKETGDWLELTAGAGSIEALREQSQIFWWLASGERPEGAAEAAVRVAMELDSVSLTPPPPASQELMARRLSGSLGLLVTIEDFDSIRNQSGTLAAVAGTAAELTPLVSAGTVEAVEVPVFAHAVYTELVLARLIEQEMWQEEERRRVREEARKRAAEQQQQEAPDE